MSCHLPHGHSHHCHKHHGHSHHTHGHGHSHHCHKHGHSHSSSSATTAKVAGHCKKPTHGQPSHQPQPIQHAAPQPAGQPSTTATNIYNQVFKPFEAARRQPQPQPQTTTPVSSSSKTKEKTQPQVSIPPAPPAPPVSKDLIKSVPAPKTEEKTQPQANIPPAPPAPPLPQNLLQSTLVQPAPAQPQPAAVNHPPANNDLLASIRAFNKNELNNVAAPENNNLGASRIAPAAGGNDLLASLMNSKIFNGITQATQTNNDAADSEWNS